MKFHYTIFVLPLLVLAAAGTHAHTGIPDTAKCSELTVFVAKKFYTMNPGRPEARAIAVCNERIVSVANSLDELSVWTQRIPTKVDKRFADKVVFPGFIDAHQHPLLGAITANLPSIAAMDVPQAYGPDIPGVKNEAEAFARMQRYEADMNDPTAPLLIWGWDAPVMGRHLTRQDLDKISSSRAVIVWDTSEHHAYLNSAAIAQRKITKDTKLNGVGRDEKGELNGQFLGVEAASFAIGPAIASKLQPAEARRLMHWLIDLNRRNGITTTTDHAMGLLNVDAEIALQEAIFNDPNTPQRLVSIAAMHAFVRKYGDPDKAIVALRKLQQRSTDRLTFNGVKFFADDSFNGLTFKPGSPGYIDGSQGIWVTPPEQLTQAIEPWWNAGMQIFIHTIGVDAQDATLAALRALQAKKPRFDHRFTFEHFGLARYDQIRSMQALGAQANVNVYYPWLRGETYPEVIGTDRAEDLSPLGSLTLEGVPTTFHSDFPVAPPKPLLGVTLATTRVGQSGRKTLGADQRVSVQQALRMITIDAAKVLGLDNKVGSLEPGKLADFTILEKDPHKVSPKDIRNIQVWGTVLAGRVYPASEIGQPGE